MVNFSLLTALPHLEKDNHYISPDKDCRNGGMWKMFNYKGFRIATWNKDLTKMVGK